MGEGAEKVSTSEVTKFKFSNTTPISRRSQEDRRGSKGSMGTS